MSDGTDLTVYDYRTDVRNVVVTPEIRGRFLRMEPGETGPSHSHDVGHEVFVVLEGQAEFVIDGRRAVLGPGQMCFARAGELHEVRVVGDEPMTLYLSVTPHLEPTHTFWSEQQQRLPPAYGVWTPAGTADQPPLNEPLASLAARFAAANGVLADTLAAHSESHAVAVGRIKAREDAGDLAGAKLVVDSLGVDMREMYVKFQSLMAAWNDLALRLSQLGHDPPSR